MSVGASRSAWFNRDLLVTTEIIANILRVGFELSRFDAWEGRVVSNPLVVSRMEPLAG